MKKTLSGWRGVRHLLSQSLLGVVVFAAACDPQGGTFDASDFGFGAMLVDGKAAMGERPLLVVLMNHGRSDIPWAHGADYYEKLFFGPSGAGEINVRDFFRENSRGRFTWKKAAVMGPYELEYPATGDATIQMALAQALREAAADGFDFESLDVDGDGTVGGAELGLMVVDNGSKGGGAVRWPGCVRPSGSRVDICMNGAVMGEEASFATAAHELAHLLGTWDLYGTACRSYAATLMSCTIVWWDDAMETYHLDPWHKMQLGWAEPRLVELLTAVGEERGLALRQGEEPAAPVMPLALNTGDAAAIKGDLHASCEHGGETGDQPVLTPEMLEELRNPSVAGQSEAAPLPPAMEPGTEPAGDEGGCAALEVPAGGANAMTEEQRPVLLYTSARSGTEYFMLEARNPRPDASAAHYDRDVGSRGVAIWHVRATDRHNLAIVPGAGDGQEAAHFTYGAPNGDRGWTSFWRSEHGTFPLRWIDGTTTGIVAEVGPMAQAARRVEVEWGVGSLRASSIESAEAESTNLVLKGYFGVAPRNRSVVVVAGGVATPVTPSSWSCGRVVLPRPSAGDRIEIRSEQGVESSITL